MKKILLLLVLNGLFSSCNDVEKEVKSIIDSKCEWCNSIGAKPYYYYENGVKRESTIKFCSRKCFTEYYDSKQ